jgi:hypothetical protein
MITYKSFFVKLKISIYFLIIIASKCYAQIQEYFPLHLGDSWQYSQYSGNDVMIHYYTVVDVDTLNDGSNVYEVLSKYNTKYYYKINSNDSNTVYYSGPENNFSFYPLYKVNTRPNEFWFTGIEWMFLKDEGMGTSHWGRTDWVKLFWVGYNINDSIYATEARYLMKNIGLIYREYDIGLVVLDGCKIEGKIYGFFVGVEDEDKKIITHTTLKNYPNPFNGQTIIQYSIPESDYINITIYDILGKEVDVILSDYQESGTHCIKWVAENLTSGIYFAVIKYKNKLLTHKLLYQK